MQSPRLDLVDAAGMTVWRVGRAPDPWAWVDRQYAGNARWDDPRAEFRTVYAAESLYGCFVEILAYARPDREPDGSELLAGIDEDPEDAMAFPTPPAGSIERTWLIGRMIACAHLHGRFIDVRASRTIEPSSRLLHHITSRLVDPRDPELQRAMELHGLTWRA